MTAKKVNPTTKPEADIVASKPAPKPQAKPVPQKGPVKAKTPKGHLRICLLKDYFDSKEGKLFKKGAIVSMSKDDPAVKHGYDMDADSEEDKGDSIM